MTIGRYAVILLAGLVFAAGLGPSGAHAMADESGSVYLFRGGMNVFSLGLDTLGDELEEVDVPAHVKSTGAWRSIAADIAEKYETDKSVLPVVLMGHSWGANAAMLMAADLHKRGVPVALVVTFDLLNDIKATPNVKHVINFYVGGGGVPANPAPGFSGEIENVDVKDVDEAIWHLTIDKDERLHARVIEATLEAYGRER